MIVRLSLRIRQESPCDARWTGRGKIRRWSGDFFKTFDSIMGSGKKNSQRNYGFNYAYVRVENEHGRYYNI